MKIIKNLSAWEVLKALESGQGIKYASIVTNQDLARCTRLIQQLEEFTGLELVNHKERPSRLSKNAATLLPVIKELISSHQKLMSAIEALKNEKINFKISIPINSPRKTIYPLLKACAKKYPELELEIFADCDHEDVLRGKIDAAYLPYRPPTDGLILFPISDDFISVPLASPKYIQKYGLPCCPEDMCKHRVIIRSGRNYPMTQALWKGKQSRQLVYKEIAFSGDVLSAKESLLAGEGVAVDLSFSSCEKEFEEGLVIPVLGGWHKAPWRITLAVKREFIHNQRIMTFMRNFAEKEAKAALTRNKKILEVLKTHERVSLPEFG